MYLVPRYGAFVARQPLTATKARALAGAGLRVVVIQVEWQRSRLAQRHLADLHAEQEAALAAGLAVWWWAWVSPTRAHEIGRRPTGPRALEQRLRGLIAEVRAPDGVFVDAEVGGGWRPRALPELPEFAGAVRAAGLEIVGLTSHARIAPSWSAEVFNVGAPQIYGGEALTPTSVRESLATWEATSCLWPVLGCADEASTPAQMQGDLAALAELGVPGALWWTARQLRHDNGRLAAAVPSLDGSAADLSKNGLQ